MFQPIYVECEYYLVEGNKVAMKDMLVGEKKKDEEEENKNVSTVGARPFLTFDGVSSNDLFCWGYDENSLYVARFESFPVGGGKYQHRWYCMKGSKGVDILEYNNSHKTIRVIDVLNIISNGIRFYVAVA